MKSVRTDILDIAYAESGPTDGPVAILLHGFPYSYRSYDEVAPLLAAKGYRVLLPELRGYGATRFLSLDTTRSGEQAALGADLRDFMDALDVEDAVLAGYDWGGRAAVIVAALWPERVRGLVTCNCYNLQNIAASGKPADALQEQRYWYQYYFNIERGRAGLTQNRRELCRLMWELWSPTWTFSDATFEESAVALDNPDFVEVSIHSYRHRYANIAGDPVYAEIEAKLATQPKITVPSIGVQGSDDGVHPPHTTDAHGQQFTGRYERRMFAGIGHNPPQEAPVLFAQAVMDVTAE